MYFAFVPRIAYERIIGRFEPFCATAKRVCACLLDIVKLYRLGAHRTH